ncbi:MAG: 1-acyl-sn-glycerol-3-phosphate acyltransferase [Deltaproteobacteria bacterium]|nr:1-acyl-sn-glycerol-3-phosphate acyltransferase [Deltaproteobacteria bacterium]
MKIFFNILNRLWRVFATGLSFTLFGIGGLILSLVYFPLISFLFKSEVQKKQIVRSSVSLGFRLFMNFMHYIGVLYFHKKKIEILQNEKSCILIANHPTLIDVIAIIAYCPDACCVVKQELWENFFLKGVVQNAGYVPNIDSTNLLEKCKKSIENGDVLIIFPEGTRTKPGQPPVFQRGAAHIALNLKCPVRCVEIQCQPLTLTKGLPWYQVPERRTDYTIEVKNRIDPQECIAEGTSRPLAARKITRIFLNQYCGNV